jgi:hypothetical protein
LESILDGVPAPLGETDREPDGVEVEAKREDTEAFEALYGSEDIEEATDWLSRVLGSLREGGALFGVTEGSEEASSGGGMKNDGRDENHPYAVVSICQKFSGR